MKSSLVKFGVILIGFILYSNAEVWGEDWKRYGQSEIGSYHYDQQSVTRVSKGIVKVRSKIVLSKKGVATAVERFGKDYEKSGYDISLREVNCTNKTQHWMSSTLYSVDGEPVRTFHYNVEWEPVYKGSLADTLLQTVCK